MRKLLFILLAACLAGSAAAQMPQQRRMQNIDQKDPRLQLEKFGQFYTYLIGSYVDTINVRQLTETAIKQMLAELDPHSAYVTPEEMKGVEESFAGSFSGIGVEFNVLNDTIIVVNTIVGGPSEKVGVQPNDRIVTIDGVPVTGLTREQVPPKLRGPKGSAVEIGVARRGEPNILSFRIVRDDIPITSVDATYKLDKETGYIKVNRFAKTTVTEMNEALDKLGKINALVLDLRGNGGGLLDQAFGMASLFLPKGSAVVSTEGRLVRPESVATEKDGRFTKGKLVVLIDESSASASEIVSGAIQDWDRGLIVGRRSFGKGLVQRQFPLIDGSAVRITVARYHTPTGRVIQRPFEMGHKDEYYASHMDRLDQRGLDTIPGIDSLRYKTLRKGRTVYGGGGIYPDVYVALDTTGYSLYGSQLTRRGVINEFITDYLDTHRASIESQYKTYEDFAARFVVGDEIFRQLSALGEKQGVPLDQEGLDAARARLSIYLKALISQRIWTTNEFYRTTGTIDNAIEKAREVLGDWNKYASGLN